MKTSNVVLDTQQVLGKCFFPLFIPHIVPDLVLYMQVVPINVAKATAWGQCPSTLNKNTGLHLSEMFPESKCLSLCSVYLQSCDQMNRQKFEFLVKENQFLRRPLSKLHMAMQTTKFHIKLVELCSLLSGLVRILCYSGPSLRSDYLPSFPCEVLTSTTRSFLRRQKPRAAVMP